MSRADVLRCATAALAVFLALALSSPAAAQLGQGRMQGRVTDASGNPLEGVEVVAHNPDVTPSTLTATTDENGRWAIIGFTNDEWRFTFSKEGYVDHEVTAHVRMLSRNPNMDVSLEAASASGAGVVSSGESLELYREGNQLFDAGDYAGALAKWEEFLEKNPNVYQTWVNIGIAKKNLGDTEGARAAFETVLEYDEWNTRALYNIGELHIEAGDIDAALPYFEKVIDSSPEDPAVYYNVAEIYFDRREAAVAVEYYQQALDVDPTFAPAQLQMGYAYLNMGNMEGAITAFEKYLELVPEDDPQAAQVRDLLAAIKESS